MTKMEMPAVALRGLTILPKMVIPFDVSRPQSIAAVEKAMLQEQKIFLVAQKNAEKSEISTENLYQIGTIARVVQVVKMPQNVSRVMVEGLERAQLLEFSSENPYLTAVVELYGPVVHDTDSLTEEAMLRIIKDSCQNMRKRICVPMMILKFYSSQ